MTTGTQPAKLRCGICIWYAGWGVGLIVFAGISGYLAIIGSRRGDAAQATQLVILAAICLLIAVLLIVASRLKWAQVDTDGLRWRTLLTGVHHIRWQDVDRIIAPGDRSLQRHLQLVSHQGELTKVRAISKILVPGAGVPSTDRRYREAVTEISRAHQAWWEVHG